MQMILSSTMAHTGRLLKTSINVFEFYAVSSLALVIEAVNPADRGRLVISAQEKEVLRIFDLVREEQTYRLQTPLSPIHVVPEEKVVGRRREPPVLEEAEDIMVLSVRVAGELDGRVDLEKHGLRQEDLVRELAKLVHSVEQKANVLLMWVFCPDYQELVDDIVNVDLPPFCFPFPRTLR